LFFLAKYPEKFDPTGKVIVAEEARADT